MRPKIARSIVSAAAPEGGGVRQGAPVSPLDGGGRGGAGGVLGANGSSPTTMDSSWLDTREFKALALGRFEGRRSSAAGRGGGRLPKDRAGAVHRRLACGPSGGSASNAGRARPSQAIMAVAPARRSWGVSTLRPGATRAGTGGHGGSVGAPRCPSCPARQQRLMP